MISLPLFPDGAPSVQGLGSLASVTVVVSTARAFELRETVGAGVLRLDRDLEIPVVAGFSTGMEG